MSLEIESLKAEIERLSQRLAVIEVGRDIGADGEGAAAGDAGGANEAQVIPQQKLRAFDVTCDGRENDPWLVYLPEGCISYAGFTPDVIDPAPDATTHLADLQNATKNGGIYAHLYLELDDDSDRDSSTEPEVIGFPLLSIDTTPTQTPSEENIKVINIKIATITNGAVSQNVSSALMLGGGGGGSSYTPPPAPFDLNISEIEDPDTHEKTKSVAVVNRSFYWDGELKTATDGAISGTCTVYLRCKQPAPTSSGEQPWEFSVGTSEEQAPSGGRAINFKLYDLSNYEVTMDYRTTFLELNSPHQVSYFKVAKPDAEDTDPMVELSALKGDALVHVRNNDGPDAHLKATSSKAELQIVDKTVVWHNGIVLAVDSAKAQLYMLNGSKSVDLDPKYLMVGTSVKFHKLTVNHSNGTKTEYDVIADKDIVVNEGSGGGGGYTPPNVNLLKEVTLEYTGGTLYMTKTKYNLNTGAETTEGPTQVFTTTPHSEEIGG